MVRTRLNYCDYSGDARGVAGRSSVIPSQYTVTVLLTPPMPASTYPKQNKFIVFNCVLHIRFWDKSLISGTSGSYFPMNTTQGRW